MNCYVTGSSGFIGKHLIKRLEAEGHVLTMTYHTCDVLIHLAAHNNIRCEFDPKLVESNIIYAKQMLTQPCRTLFASSTSAQEINNPYALSKKYGEHLVLQHPNALALRLFNVYGPGCKRGIVQRAIHCAFTHAVFDLERSGAVRDYIYIDDVVEIFTHHLNKRTGIVDVGTGTEKTAMDIIFAISSITGTPIAVREFSPADGQQKFSVAEPLPDFRYTPLEDGLTKTIEAYKKENGI